MGKTLTITDDELGATASVRIEAGRDGTPVVRAVHFDACDDRGLSSAAMGLVEALGLRLPETPPVVHAGPRRRQPAKAAKKPAPRRVPQQQAAQRPAPVAAPAVAAAGPGPAALPAPAPASAPAPAVAAVNPPAQRRYRSGPAPAVDELRRSFRDHDGNITAMAAEFGCAPGTVSGWLRKAREAGVRIDLNTAAARPAS